MGIFEKLKAALALSRAADQWEKDMKTEANPNPGISIAKGLKAVAGLALFAGVGAMALFVLEPGVIEAALAAAGVNSAYAALIVLGLRGAATAYLNWRKHNPPTPANQNAGPLILLALLPSLATAQEPAKPENTFRLSSGATRFFTPGVGDATEIEGQISVEIEAPKAVYLEGFGRFTRTQGAEPGTAGLLDVKTFRSVIAHLSARKLLGGPRFMGGHLPMFSAVCSGGMSWERDKAFDPSDPNIWAVGCGLHTNFSRGTLTVKGGHNGSVGGGAIFGELIVNQGDRVRYVATYAVPFSAERFRKNPGTFTGGLQVDVFTRGF